MPLSVFIVDAFTAVPFKGNPAAVVPLQAWLPDALMPAIAGENNLSETAFFVRDADGVFDIRWFSPLKEIGFCGHATLASAHVIASQRLAPFPLRLRAAAVGELGVERLDDGSFEMRFPNQTPALLASVPQALLDALSIAPRDVSVTAPGSSHDFVSRYFWPANGGTEDPVTGSIHAGLAPLWAQVLGKTQLTALQASARGGELGCRVEAHHVHVRGSAVQYLHGTIAL
ncbi:PhzF family phenazine biosynthesis protein [Xanthomonas graminis]|uniref:Phenazine biosynthesis PhzF family protein n=1 Tax=Xanthomonas graminis pv. phlei TaxID=487906 RepID=A0A0K3A2W9_9XANT|nr:PhzF family phenazine biosynthesis protein [Xanthomonas translucens]UKE65153.1 PhzF family phenazine biosynthesis protein [Xanthomonas translucens pv. phlei]CTP92436.1 phenazine biosynthesis PhzF family protein [Xanthomonas translucens pv. phlei]